MKKLFILSCLLVLFASLAFAQESAPPATVAPSGADGIVAAGPLAKEVFTTDVKDRAPVDELASVSGTVRKVFFYTEVKGLANQEVTHRWEYNGKVMSEVKFNVGAPRWRMWSSKNLKPDWTGEWKVSVVDSTGKVLGEKSFNYGK